MIDTGGNLTYACFVDDGSKIFTTNLEGQVSVYDAQTMEVITQKTNDYSVDRKHISSMVLFVC